MQKKINNQHYFEAPDNLVALAAVAQLVERVLGKDEVMGSNPISSFLLVDTLVRFMFTGNAFVATQFNPFGLFPIGKQGF